MRTRRPVFLAGAVTTALLLSAAGAYAGGVVSTAGSGTDVATLVVTVDESSPTTGNPCPPDGETRFETVPMTVSVTGDYSFRSSGYEGSSLFAQFAAVEDGVPDSECADLFPFDGLDGEDRNVTLQSGTTYNLYVSAFDFSDSSSETLGVVGTAVRGTQGVVTFNDEVDAASPQRVGPHEVTGNGTKLAAIDYTLDAASPVSPRFVGTDDFQCDDEEDFFENVSYETVRMTVSESGSYRIRSSFLEDDARRFGFVAVHEGVVDSPSDPGCLFTTDESEAEDLEAGTTYTVFLAAVDESVSPNESLLGRWVISLSPADVFDGRVTFLPAGVTFEQAQAACAPGAAAPAGYNVVDGSSRNETLRGVAGEKNLIRGFAGNDTLIGAGEDDILCGGAGNDSLQGGAGEDFLFGEAGNDSLQGGADDDVIAGGLGNDALNGGAGFDIGLDTQGNNTFTSIESRTLTPTPVG